MISDVFDLIFFDHVLNISEVLDLIFWSRAQHHVTTSLMKLAVGERNVATNLGTTPGCVVEYCFSIFVIVCVSAMFDCNEVKGIDCCHRFKNTLTRKPKTCFLK